jgi:hypothetical protein
MKIRALIVAGALAAGAAGFAAAPADATNIGNEGCTPGYWKNHTDNWEEYAASDPLDWQFNFPDSLAGMRDDTWLEALGYGGGPGTSGAAQILMRAATASFLNAAHEGVGFPLRRFTDPGNMLAEVNAALASGSRTQMLALATYLDGLNNLGCPLN